MRLQDNIQEIVCSDCLSRRVTNICQIANVTKCVKTLWATVMKLSDTVNKTEGSEVLRFDFIARGN